jgi:replicative DNA helicase
MAMTVAEHARDPTDPGPTGPRVPNREPAGTPRGHHRAQPPAQVAPHDLDAEAALLSAALTDPATVAVLDGLPPDAFYHPGHLAIAQAIIRLDEDGLEPDPVTVAARLRETGDHDHAAHLLLDIAARAAPPTAAPSYATILVDHQRRRRALAIAGELEAAARDGQHQQITHLLAQATRDLTPTDKAGDTHERYATGGTWVLDAPPGIPAVWGQGDDVLWAEGESLILAGPSGVGKTTITGQLVFARLGLYGDGHVLDHPVAPTGSSVLYLAMDRPRQIQRALGRLAQADHRRTLDERLIARPGPPPQDLAKHPEVLAYMATRNGADTVIIDSLKDAAIGLADDEVGSSLNRAMQIALAEGIQVLALHHQRKGQNGHKPKSLEDLYGSTWIAAGAGSVVLLWGNAGDPLVELSHLKQPGAPVGPLKLEHDHLAGTTTVAEGFDLLAYLRRQPRPVTTESAAAAARGGGEPSANERRQMTRKLTSLMARGMAVRTEEPTPGGGKATALWSAPDDRHGEPHP